ncbi:60S ribosomal export protein NMD3 isoform X2 [Parasteatoda tepidariorum]|nr:60S ribosomal export protein NMD3 isoform X2 [Parasteatoda tepidariorum]
MCIPCIKTQVDISEGIPKQVIIYFCKGCGRYLQPPAQWVSCALESRELLAFCLKKLKGLNQVHLVDATFIWTEPHSRRIKVKLTIQKEVFGGAILQQVFVVEYVVSTNMCSDCHKSETHNVWRAVVQLRQRVQHKRTFFYLEQLILKYQMHSNCLNIKTCNDGLDFFFGKKDDARKMVDFFSAVVPCKYSTSQQLISHDVHSNTFDYKYTFSVEIVPVCKNDVVCLPLSLARSFGNIGQISICHRVTNSVYLIDPCTLQIADITNQQFWRSPFHPIGSMKQLTEYVVMDISLILDSERRTFTGQGPISHKHVLSDAWVVRSSELGVNDTLIHTRTHLGHILKPGDYVLGLDLSTINVNNVDYNKLKKENIPDVVLVKKIYEDKASRHRRRKWKLKHLEIEADTDTSSIQRDYDDFLEDLEEDVEYRQNVNIYKDHEKLAIDTDEVDDDCPKITLQDMLDDLTLEDATGVEGGAMLE